MEVGAVLSYTGGGASLPLCPTTEPSEDLVSSAPGWSDPPFFPSCATVSCLAPTQMPRIRPVALGNQPQALQMPTSCYRRRGKSQEWEESGLCFFFVKELIFIKHLMYTKYQHYTLNFLNFIMVGILNMRSSLLNFEAIFKSAVLFFFLNIFIGV